MDAFELDEDFEVVEDLLLSLPFDKRLQEMKNVKLTIDNSGNLENGLSCVLPIIRGT